MCFLEVRMLKRAHTHFGGSKEIGDSDKVPLAKQLHFSRGDYLPLQIASGHQKAFVNNVVPLTSSSNLAASLLLRQLSKLLVRGWVFQSRSAERGSWATLCTPNRTMGWQGLEGRGTSGNLGSGMGPWHSLLSKANSTGQLLFGKSRQVNRGEKVEGL